MSNAKIGLGTRLEYSSTVSATSGYAHFHELLDIDSPSPEYAMVDVTNMDSTAAREYIPQTLVDGGQIDVTMHYTSANATLLNGLLRLRRGWRIDYPNSACHRFKGYLTSWSMTAPVEDKMTCKATIKVVSLPSYSATTTIA